MQQPAIRLDYQLSSKLRVTGKYSGERARVLTRPGLIQGFTDALTPYPFITNYGITVNYALSPTTFVEGTYGFIRNELAGGNENGILVNDVVEPAHLDAGLPPDLQQRRRSSQGELRLRGHGSDGARRSGMARPSICRPSSTGAAVSAPRRRTSAIPAG